MAGSILHRFATRCDCFQDPMVVHQAKPGHARCDQQVARLAGQTITGNAYLHDLNCTANLSDGGAPPGRTT